MSNPQATPQEETIWGAVSYIANDIRIERWAWYTYQNNGGFLPSTVGLGDSTAKSHFNAVGFGKSISQVVEELGGQSVGHLLETEAVFSQQPVPTNVTVIWQFQEHHYLPL